MFTARMEIALGVKSVEIRECTSSNAALKLVSKRWKRKSMSCHPDRGGDAEAMKELNSQYDLAKTAIEYHFRRNASSAVLPDQVTIRRCWICMQLLRLRSEQPCNFHCTRCGTYMASDDPRGAPYVSGSAQTRPAPNKQRSSKRWQPPKHLPTQPQQSTTQPPGVPQRAAQWRPQTRFPPDPSKKIGPIASAKRRSEEDRLRIARENEIRARARLDAKGDLELYARLVAERLNGEQCKRARS